MVRGAFLGLETARKGLLAARAGLDTTGHNIANAGTEGYSRQRVTTTASFPLAYPGAFFTLRPGMIGTGAEVTGITQVRSQFIDSMIQREGSEQSRLGQTSEGLSRIEDIFGEPAGDRFSGLMDEFFNSWEDLSNDPESLSARTNLREAGTSLTDFVRDVDFNFKNETQQLNNLIRDRVGQVNSLATQIADVNRQIQQSETEGARLSVKANDLVDQRQRLVEEMSKLVNVRTLDSPDHSVNILIEGHPIVTGGDAHGLTLRLRGKDPDKLQLEFEKSGQPVPLRSGELAGLYDLRDNQLAKVKEGFATLITAFTNKVNQLHQGGYGLDGLKGRSFFQDIETRQAAGTQFLPAATTGDTTIDSLGITSGDFFIQGQRVEIKADEVLPGRAIKLSELLERIQAASPDIRASLDTSAGAPRIVISQFNPASGKDELKLEDGNSNFFEVSGIDKAPIRDLQPDPPFDNSLASFRLSTNILNNLNAIAAAGDDGQGFTGPGDNRTALALSDLKNSGQALFGSSFGEYFESGIAALGAVTQSATRARDSQTLVVQQLEERRQSVSGVNLDEEAVQLIKYQKAFEASARSMNVVDETLDMIINRLGTVGR